MKKILCALFVILSMVQPVSATIALEDAVAVERANEIMNAKNQRKDVIEYRFRTYNGIKQYRRWNVTQNKWVDDRWINLL
jgi:hypothetical protein